MDLAVAVNTTTFKPKLFDKSQQSFVVILTGRLGLIDLGIVTTTMNLHHATEGYGQQILDADPV